MKPSLWEAIPPVVAVLVTVWHYIWVYGYLYDQHNLFSHEALVAFLLGSIAYMVILVARESLCPSASERTST